MVESQFLKRMRSGDRAAFEDMVRAHQRLVYHLAYRLTGDREEAGDITQETFLRAWMHVASFRGDCKIASWLARIARSLCLNALRARGRMVEMDERLAVDDRSPERVVLERELTVSVDEAIASLPPRYRAVLVLHHAHGMSYDDIAAALDCPVGTVKTWIHRARQRLRRILSEGGLDRG